MRQEMTTDEAREQERRERDRLQQKNMPVLSDTPFRLDDALRGVLRRAGKTDEEIESLMDPLSNPHYHYAGCWRDHHECAVKVIERLREMGGPVVDAVLNRTPDATEAEE